MTTTEFIYGWLILLVVVTVNQLLAMRLMRDGRRALSVSLMVAVPAFMGHALAMVGIQLLGTPS